MIQRTIRKMKNHLLSNALIEPYQRQRKNKEEELLSEKFGTFSPYEYLSKRRVAAYFCISPATIGGKLLPPLVPVILISRPGLKVTIQMITKQRGGPLYAIIFLRRTEF